MRAADDLQIVVNEANQAERERRDHRNPGERIGQIGPQQCRDNRCGEDQQPAHRWRAGFGPMRGRAFLADHLSDLKLAELPDHDRTKREAEDQCGQTGGRRTERDVARDVEGANLRVQRVEEVVEHQANSSLSRSTTASVPMPREPFTRTRSPGLTRSSASAAASLLEATCDTEAAGIPASTAAAASAAAAGPPTAIRKSRPAARVPPHRIRDGARPSGRQAPTSHRAQPPFGHSP